MKRFATVILIALMLLTTFAFITFAADNNTIFTVDNAIEAYSPVYYGSNLTGIIAKQGSNAITMDGNNFTVFNYDLNTNVTTESLSIENTSGTSGRVIGKHGLVYSTKIEKTTYKYTSDAPNDTDWSSYPTISFFGEKYVPLKPNDISRIAKLLIDSDLKYSLATGEKLDLGQGYSLRYKQISGDDRVLLEFDKNGQFVDNAVIGLLSSKNQTWTCNLNNIQGVNNVPVLKVHVNPIFDSNPLGSVIQIDGLWLIDYANPLTISTSDKFGKLNDVSINGSTLTASNKDALTLTRDSYQEIGQKLYFKIADSDELRFYTFKEYTDPGTYDLRGQIISGLQNFNWNESNFAGFYYDFENNISTESLSVSGINGRVIPENGLRYSTTIKKVDYKYTDYNPDPKDTDWGSYPAIGFFGDEYVPLKSNEVNKIAKLVIDNNPANFKYTLKLGYKLNLGKGYSLQFKRVSDDGKDRKVLLEFDKDGQSVDNAVIGLLSNQTWTCNLNNIQGVNNVSVLKVHINPIFDSSPFGSVIQIDGLWLIDYANPLTISTSDKFGKLNNVSINGSTLTISNNDALTLTRDSYQEIGQRLHFKIADSDELRFYPYFQKTINSEINVTSLSGPVAVNNKTSAAGVGTSNANSTITEKKQSPDLGGFFVIFGLLAVSYFQSSKIRKR